MDTIVIFDGIPGVLAFFDQEPETLMRIWQNWAERGQTIRATHTSPDHDAVIFLRPASIGTVQFIPNDPAGRKAAERMLWALPRLQDHTERTDLPPENTSYWTNATAGYSATIVTTPDGEQTIELSNWELGRF